MVCTASYTVVRADLVAGATLSNTATATGFSPAGDPVSSDPSTVRLDNNVAVAPVLAFTGSTLSVMAMWFGVGLLLAGIALLFLRRNATRRQNRRRRTS